MTSRRLPFAMHRPASSMPFGGQKNRLRRWLTAGHPTGRTWRSQLARQLIRGWSAGTSITSRRFGAGHVPSFMPTTSLGQATSSISPLGRPMAARVALVGHGDLGDGGLPIWSSHVHVIDVASGERILKRPINADRARTGGSITALALEPRRAIPGLGQLRRLDRRC